jgi:hypothetical protein
MRSTGHVRKREVKALSLSMLLVLIGVCGATEQKSGLSYELASQADWQERKKRRFRSCLLILCFLYIFCLLM